jgi:hypothetical protein
MPGATNAQKVPLARSLNDFAIARSKSALAQVGKSLPCSVVSVSGSIVTVKFELKAGVLTMPQVTIPVFGPEYIRYPIQPGDKGMAISADAYLGQMTGLGDGVADLTPRGNLSMLVFMPIGNKNWSASGDPLSTVIYGPNGVVLKDAHGDGTLTLNGHSLSVKVPAEIRMTAPTTVITGNLTVGTGATGTFTTPTGQTVTVTDGIVTSIF